MHQKWGDNVLKSCPSIPTVVSVWPKLKNVQHGFNQNSRFQSWQTSIVAGISTRSRRGKNGAESTCCDYQDGQRLGPMVSVLSFYSGDTSSSPTEALFVFCSIFGKNKNIKKSRWLAHLKKNILFLFNSFFSSVRNHFDYIEFLFLIACCKSRDYF